MSQDALFSVAPTEHVLLQIHGQGSFTGRTRLLAGAFPPTFVLTTRSAARVWGLSVGPPTPFLDLAVPQRPCRPPAALPLEQFPPEDITEQGGLRVTTKERTAFDCACHLPRYEALASVDAFLRAGVSHSALQARANRAQGPGSSQAQAVIAMADPGAQSPGESLVRGVFLDAGFPRPATQLKAPPTPYRLDLGHPEYQCAAEYDGEQHHTGMSNRARDSLRRSILAGHGWRILPITKEFRSDPAPYLEAWLTLLMTAGWSPTPRQLAAITNRITRLRRKRRHRHH